MFFFYYFLFFIPRRAVLEKEDWRSIIGLVTNAKQVMNSVQDVAGKLADYAKFRSVTDSSGEPWPDLSKKQGSFILSEFTLSLAFVI